MFAGWDLYWHGSFAHTFAEWDLYAAALARHPKRHIYAWYIPGTCKISMIYLVQQ